MNKPRYHSLPAFSLIEIMVVVSMVTVGFISVVGLVQKAIVLYYNNKNVLIANNLAQEGVELARFVRDDNWMTPVTYPVANNYFARSISVDYGGTNPIDPVQQKNGNLFIFGLDPRITSDDSNRSSITQFYKKFTAVDTSTGNVLNLNPACLGVIKDCLKLPAARLYRDETDATNIINRYLSAAPTAAQFDTGFSRLLVSEYRDPNNTPLDFSDDYLHLESWVHWSDRGQDKFFHLDTDLYDYSWRY